MAENNSNEEKDYLIRGIDEEVYKKFKSKCSLEGVSMKSKINELILGYIKK